MADDQRMKQHDYRGNNEHTHSGIRHYPAAPHATRTDDDQVDDRYNSEELKDPKRRLRNLRKHQAPGVPSDVTLPLSQEILPEPRARKYPKVKIVPAVLQDKVLIVDQVVDDFVSHNCNCTAGEHVKLFGRERPPTFGEQNQHTYRADHVENVSMTHHAGSCRQPRGDV